MPNSTCRLLSNGYKFDYQFNNELRLRPCCLFPDYTVVHGQASLDQYRQRIKDIDSYQDPRCERCNFFETQELRRTWRQTSFDIVPADADTQDASYLELQLDNVCNGGCITCGPEASSFWASENFKHGISFAPRQRVDQVQRILELIDIQTTRKILFLGGEPFLSAVDQQILPLIKRPELVDLQYTTNGSFAPNITQKELWKKFKSVLINFSIDGIGSRFEYVRYPLKWQIVSNNMLNMRDTLPANVSFKINHTINILNLFYWQEFDHWRASEFSQDKFKRTIPCTYNPAIGKLNPCSVTPSLKQLILNEYGEQAKPSRTIKDTKLDSANIITYLDDLDRRRQLNWREIFSEVAGCL